MTETDLAAQARQLLRDTVAELRSGSTTAVIHSDRDFTPTETPALTCTDQHTPYVAATYRDGDERTVVDWQVLDDQDLQILRTWARRKRLADRAAAHLRDVARELRETGDSDHTIVDTEDFADEYGLDDSDPIFDCYGLTYQWQPRDGEDHIVVLAEYVDGDGSTAAHVDAQVLDPEDVARIRAWAHTKRTH